MGQGLEGSRGWLSPPCQIPTWDSKESKILNSSLAFQIVMKLYVSGRIDHILFNSLLA